MESIKTRFLVLAYKFSLTPVGSRAYKVFEKHPLLTLFILGTAFGSVIGAFTAYLVLR